MHAVYALFPASHSILISNKSVFHPSPYDVNFHLSLQKRIHNVFCCKNDVAKLTFFFVQNCERKTQIDKEWNGALRQYIHQYIVYYGVSRIWTNFQLANFSYIRNGKHSSTISLECRWSYSSTTPVATKTNVCVALRSFLCIYIFLWFSCCCCSCYGVQCNRRSSMHSSLTMCRYDSTERWLPEWESCTATLTVAIHTI